MLFLGEQPGDHEDRTGHPFVGPAGQLLDRALAAAGIDRAETYVTNAVKHFKWEPSGPRRLHKKPNGRVMAACRPWLVAEIESINPALIVCLGATAAQAVFTIPVRVLKESGHVTDSPFGVAAMVTLHPSALLRIRDRDDREKAFADLVRDLEIARDFQEDASRRNSNSRRVHPSS